MQLEEFSENELRTLEGLVNSEREWGLITKMMKRQIAIFWDQLRLTDPADDARVATNHKLAVGVEASLGNFVKEAEAVANHRKLQSQEPKIIEDQTKELY